VRFDHTAIHAGGEPKIVRIHDQCTQSPEDPAAQYTGPRRDRQRRRAF
jgi:hypothetical protein